MNARAANDEPAHYHGHRARLRQRLLQAGSEAVADYELVELALFRAIPRRDVKPLAKALIARFGSFAQAIAAEPARLTEIEGVSEGAIAEFKIVETGAKRFAKGAVRKRLPVGSAPSSTIAERRWPSTRARNSGFCFSTARTA
jgi:DNA repair protein RadC